jgi:hypothetical protein
MTLREKYIKELAGNLYYAADKYAMTVRISGDDPDKICAAAKELSDAADAWADRNNRSRIFADEMGRTYEP